MIYAMNLDQPFMDLSDDELAAVFSRLKGGKFDWIVLAVGAWGSDHLLHRSKPDAVMTGFVDKAHAEGFKVLACVYGGGFYQVPNISQVSDRQTMADEAKGLLQDVPFDGFADDLEEFVGTDPVWYNNLGEYVDFLNRQTAAVHSVGKINCPFLAGGWMDEWGNVSSFYTEVFPNVYADYVLHMFYGMVNGVYASEAWARDVSASLAPSIIGLVIHEEGVPPLADQLAWFDAQPDKGAGVFIWHFNFMTDEDWSVWNSWVGAYAPPVVPPVVPPVDYEALYKEAQVALAAAEAAVVVARADLGLAQGVIAAQAAEMSADDLALAQLNAHDAEQDLFDRQLAVDLAAARVDEAAAEAALAAHLAGEVSPLVQGSPMWVATECGISSLGIDKLRVFGHEVLPQSFIEAYHVDGESLSLWLRDHPQSRAVVKWLLQKALGFLEKWSMKK